MNLKPQESLFENKKVRIVDENTIWVDGKQFISMELYEELKAVKINKLEEIQKLDPYEVGYTVGKLYNEIADIINLLKNK